MDQKIEIKPIWLENLVKVESSNIDMIGYKDDTTYVQFKNGTVYSYPETSMSEFEALIKSESVGSQFSKTYKNKQKYEKLAQTELKKQRLNEEQLELAVLSFLCFNKMELEEPTIQKAKELIKLVKENI